MTSKSGPINILVVDDEPQVCEVIRDWLGRCGFTCLTANNHLQAKQLLEQNPTISVLIADIRMPEVSGLELLAYVRKGFPSCRVILISAMCETECLAEALSLGAFDFLAKPLDLSKLEATICSAISTTELDSPGHLSLRAAQAMQVEAKLRQVSLDSIRALVHAVEAKDPYTRLHSEQVAHYVTELVRFMDNPIIDEATVRIAALLHDIGKIGVPDNILTKPGELTKEEFEYIRRHPALGGEILAHIPLFATEAHFVRHHHEKWDGSGYPAGLKADEIPLGARIIHVADAMDAMLMARTYKNAYPVERMINELVVGTGRQFDPDVAVAAVDWCHACPDKLILPRAAAA